jgi:intracellular multiplication protein IcmB
LPQERAFLVSFLSVLATKPGDREPAEGIADLIGLVLDLAYAHFADERNPKRYGTEQDVEVDRALARYAITLETDPTWWEVVDALFDAGDREGAVRAQRFAVPVLSDLIAIAQQPQVRDLYGGSMRLVDTAESPIQLFNRVVSAATREFPILAYPTRFDLSNARVAALDVAALCGDMTPVGQRQTAVAYLLARHLLGRDLFLDDHLARAAPLRYRAYHARRFEEHLAYPKKFCVDEKHRCGPIAAVNAQLVRDQREGRKNNVQVALASQILTDFSDEMIELASSVYVMEYGNDETAADVREKFSLPASAMDLLRVQGHGPTPDGAPFLCAMKTKRGLVCQLLYLTNGPIEMWALSTTAEDRVIRRRLYQRFGASAALQALARRYPSGSARSDLERRLEHRDHPTRDRDQLIDEIVAELAGTLAKADPNQEVEEAG